MQWIYILNWKINDIYMATFRPHVTKQMKIPKLVEVLLEAVTDYIDTEFSILFLLPFFV